MDPRARIEVEEEPTNQSTARQRERRSPLRTAFESLENRDFRILWLGVGGHAFTLWMEIVARNWLVWELTGSGLALGLVNFYRTIPVLFLAVPAGVVADRFNRRTILIVTQAAILAVYATLVLLLVMNLLQLWHVYALFFLRGVAISFNQPPRQALIPTLVKQHQLSNAVALQQALFNGTRVGAPLLTGFLFVVSGSVSAFLVITVIEVLIIIAWFLLRIPESAEHKEDRPSALASTGEGLKYVLRHRAVLLLLAFGLLSLLFGQSWSVILPIIADTTFSLGADGYGTFLTAAGVGALLGPLIIAALGEFRWKGGVLVVSLIFFGGALVLFSFTPWLLVAMGVMVSVGLFESVQRVITNTLLLTQTDPAFHGRVVSLYLLDRGFVPLGSVAAGWLADLAGAAPALAIMGVALILSVAVVAAIQPRFLGLR